jgi:hypothetical protein
MPGGHITREAAIAAGLKYYFIAPALTKPMPRWGRSRLPRTQPRAKSHRAAASGDDLRARLQ